MAVCKQGCGIEIDWRKQSGSGRWQAFNAGTDTQHWDSCSQARTARVKREGVPFKDEKGDGYIFEGKKKYFHMVAKTSGGKPVR